MGVVHGAPVRPAMVVAVLVSWARERLGSALYRQGRRGRSSWGDFAGEDGAGGGDRDGVGACQGTATAVDVVASRSASGGGAWQLDAEPGRSGLGELMLGEVRS